jgi:hypothetical protein
VLLGSLFSSSLSQAANAEPKVVASGEDFVLLEVEIDDIETVHSKVNGRSVSRVHLAGSEREYLPGHPDLPIISFALAVPPCDQINLDYTTTGTREREIDYVPPVPTVIPTHEVGAATRYSFEEGSPYESEGYTPKSAAEIRSVSWMRDCRIADVVVYPVSYNHADRMLRTLGTVTLRISFQNPRPGPVAGVADDMWENLYRNLVVNYEDSKRWRRKHSGDPKSLVVDGFTTSSNWAKLYVEEEGLYKLTGSDLSEAGISGPISVSSLRIFWGGGFPRPVPISDPRPRWMPECTIHLQDSDSDGLLDDDDYLIFHGLGPDNWKHHMEPIDGEVEEEAFYENPYVNESTYWLTWESSGGGGFQEPSHRMNQIDGSPTGGSPPGTFKYRVHVKRNVAFDLSGKTDDWFWVVLKDHPIFSTARITVKTPGYEGGEALIRTKLYGATFERFTNPDHRVQVFVNDVLSMDITWDGKTITEDSTMVNSLVDGSNEVRLYLPAGWPDPQYKEEVYLEWIEVEYDRDYMAGDDFLMFPAASSGEESYRIDGFSGSAVVVIRVDDKYNCSFVEGAEVNSTGNGFEIEFSDQADSSSRYLVSGPEAILSVAAIEIDEVTNHRNAMNSADYVVVCYDEFVEAIEPLLSLRSSRDGYQTYVAKISDLFDEFAWGMADPAAIRDFIANCDSIWQETPDFLFLVGDATYDHRNYASSSVDYVPSFHGFTSSYGDVYATDDWFVCLDPQGRDRPDLGVGRLPARSVSMLEMLVDKVYNYETSPPMSAWKNNVLLIGDDELHLDDIEYHHTEQIERFAEEKLPSAIDKTKVYLMEYPCDIPDCPQGTTKSQARAALLQAWNEGALIVNYTGHGSEIVMADERVFSFEDIESLQNGEMLAFLMAPSCKVNRFDQASGEALGEAILLASDKGSVASFASTRDSGAFSNTALADRVIEALFGGSEIYPTVALPLSLAITSAKAVGDWHNNQEFVLLGDPAMILAAPSGRVEFDPAGTDTLFVRKGVFSFKGSVGSSEDLSGGMTEIVARGATDTTIYINPEEPYGNAKYVLPGEVIFDGRGSVSAADSITGAFVVPLGSEEGKLGRLRIYAHKNFDDAVGMVSNIETSGEATSTDEEGPSIWLGFGGSSVVAPDAILEIVLRDESGINTLGGDYPITVTLNDSNEPYDVTGDFQYNDGSYQEGTVEFRLPDLWSGEHTVEVEAYDNLNLGSTESLVFTVTTTGGIRHVANYPNPFEADTYFIFTLMESAEIEIEIFTVGGRLIRTLDDIAGNAGQNQVYWDGRDDEGDELANGVYLYKIIADGRTGTVDAIGKAMLAR